jgi:hypothetical protein
MRLTNVIHLSAQYFAVLMNETMEVRIGGLKYFVRIRIALWPRDTDPYTDVSILHRKSIFIPMAE